jgi:hypothetical protein
MTEDAYTAAARHLQAVARAQADLTIAAAGEVLDPETAALLVRLAAGWVDIAHVLGLIIARHTGETGGTFEC